MELYPFPAMNCAAKKLSISPIEGEIELVPFCMHHRSQNLQEESYFLAVDSLHDDRSRDTASSETPAL